MQNVVTLGIHKSFNASLISFLKKYIIRIAAAISIDLKIINKK